VKAVRWFIGITGTILALAFLIVGAVGVIIGTESGTRWLLDLAADKAPGQLSLGKAGGTLLRGLRLESLAWEDETLEIAAAGVMIDIDLLPLLSRRLDVHRLAVSRFELRLEAREDEQAGGGAEVNLPVAISVDDASIGEILVWRSGSEFSFSNTGFSASLDGPRLEVSALTTSGYGLDVDASGRIRLAGNMPLRLDGSWRQQAPASPGLAGMLQLRGNLAEVDVVHDLRAPFAVATRGTVGLGAGGIALDLDNRWDRAEWALGERTLELTAGTLRVQGRPDLLDVTLDATGNFGEYPETRIVLAGTTDRAALDVDRLLLANAWGIGEFAGRVTRQPAIAAEFVFELSRVDPSQFIEGAAGELAAEGSASFAMSAGGAGIDVRAENVSGTLYGLSLGAAAEFAYTPALVDIRSFELAVGRNRMHAAGRVAEAVDIDAEFEFDALAGLLSGWAGAASGTISLEGPRAAPAGRIELTGSEIGYGAWGVEEFALAVHGSMAEHEIDATLRKADATIEVAASGGLDAATWSGRVGELLLAAPRFGEWSSREAAAVVAAAENVSIGNFCLVGSSDGTIACAEVDYARSGESNFRVSVEGLPVAAMPFGIPPGVTVTGTIAAEAEGTLEDGLLAAEASVRATGASLAADYEGEQARIDVPVASGTATVIANRLESSLSLRLAGETGEVIAALGSADIFDPEAAIDGSASVAIRDAGLFAIFMPAVANPRGSIEGTLDIGGTREAPVVLGAVELRDGAFLVRPAGIEIREMTLHAEQLSADELRLSGSALSGKGRITLAGRTLVGTETGIRSEIAIDGQDFELFRLPDWRMAASPDIDIVFDERAAVVTGTLAIPAADITVKTIPASAVRPSPDATVHVAGATERGTGRQIDIDVRTQLGDEVRFSGFGLTTGLTGTVRVQGGTQRPYLGFGEVDLVGGRYEAYGQDLTIERGQLIFNGPLNEPNLDIRATRSVDDVVAGIHVTGQPSRIRSEVFSQPPLSDAETLAYLVTGRPLTGATTSEEGNLLNKAAFALGMSQAGSIVSQVGGALGLESLSIEGGTESGRIVAGKRIGGRLFVEYGYGLVDKLGTLLLRYQVSRRLMLESRTGTVSNLDIVYSVKKQ
jgi:translocation and assembly module TamB